MTEHTLKINSESFMDIVNEPKKIIRKNDRNFSIGDTLYLREFDSDKCSYTGKQCVVVITDVQPCGNFGRYPEYCNLGIRHI